MRKRRISHIRLPFVRVRLPFRPHNEKSCEGAPNVHPPALLPPFFNSKLAITEHRLAFPHRSPMPLIVPWTWIAPAWTAINELATLPPHHCRHGCLTAQNSSCGFRQRSPRYPWHRSPLVSHNTIRSAPLLPQIEWFSWRWRDPFYNHRKNVRHRKNLPSPRPEIGDGIGNQF